MPIYEYQCDQCGHKSEEMQRLADAPITVCPNCGGPYRKLISAPAFQFKGSGWYVTDYARNQGGKGAGKGEGGKEEGGKSESGGETSGKGEAGTKDGGGGKEGSKESSAPKSASDSSGGKGSGGSTSKSGGD